MVAIRELTQSFLEDYPDSEEALHTILELDKQGTWTFDDVPLDSGVFGEIVSRGIVEQADDGYQLADRQAVQAVLERDEDTETVTHNRALPSITFPQIEPLVLGPVFGALLFLLLSRIFTYPSVFRDGVVVLPGNDPYFYRYWIETLLAQSAGSTTLQTLFTLPAEISYGEPFLIAVLWLGTEILGGSVSDAGVVLAWYPVLSAVTVGAIVYLLGTRVFADRRVGVAAVVMLALIPAHALRTSVGFADHHAFDFLWLAVTMFALVFLADRPTSSVRESMTGIVLLGVGITGQTLAWEAGPLLLLPVGIYVAISSMAALQQNRSPLYIGYPILIGLGGGAVLTYLIHLELGWHTPVVATVPAILTMGSCGAILLSEVAWRTDRSSKLLATIELLLLGAGGAILPQVFPDLAKGLDRGIAFLLETEGIAETMSLVSGDLGSIFGPALLFGWILFLALPYLSWVTFRIYHDIDEKALVPVVYAWFLLGLALIQVRFAGELSIPIALFAGLGFIHLLSRLELARPILWDTTPSQQSTTTRNPTQHPMSIAQFPDRDTIVPLAVVFLLVGSLSFAMVPIKMNQPSISETEYQAASWMDEYAATQGWSYPENYVFSPWGKNRMYNYFVSGDARSYSYAQTNYADFLVATDGSAWYRTLRERTGFIVTRDSPYQHDDFDQESIQTRLHTHYGSATTSTPGLSHYRAVYVSDDTSLKIFTLVPGAQIAGTAPPGTELTVTTNQSVTGTSFTYTRTVRTDANGDYTITVPYPGTYTVDGTRVQVPETAVRQNETVRVDTQ
ncbi:STT3 domain-containing protein [Haloplanus rallus]|nr:STT3 domain-containing protein [Haloplanus rallus]